MGRGDKQKRTDTVNGHAGGIGPEIETGAEDVKVTMVGGWKRKAKTKMSQVGRCWARRLRGSRRLRLIG